MKMHPLNRVLQRDNIIRIRAVIRERGWVTGGRGEVIVVSDREDPIKDLIVSGQHAVLAFYEEAESDATNTNTVASLREGLKVTRLYIDTPRFAIKYFVAEGNVLNGIKIGARSFLESYTELDNINNGWLEELGNDEGGGDDDDKPTGLRGKAYDEKLWTFVNLNFPNLYKNVSHYKNARSFKNKLVEKDLFDDYVAVASSECDFANTAFSQSSHKFMFNANQVLLQELEKGGMADIAGLVLRLAYPNRLEHSLPWVFKSRSDALNVKEMFSAVSVSEKNAISPPCEDSSRKVWPGDFSKVHNTNAVIDFMNYVEFACTDVPPERINMEHCNRCLSFIIDMCVHKKASVPDVTKSLGGKSWLHPSENMPKDFDDFWSLKKHLKKLLVHLHHPDSKGFKMQEAKKPNSSDVVDEKGSKESKAHSASSRSSSQLFNMTDMTFDSGAKMQLKRIIDATPGEGPIDLSWIRYAELIFTKHGRYDLRSDNLNKLKRINPDLSTLCNSTIIDIFTMETVQDLHRQPSSPAFHRKFLELVAPCLFTENTSVFELVVCMSDVLSSTQAED